MPIIDNREIVLDVLDKLPLCAKHNHPRVELSPPSPDTDVVSGIPIPIYRRYCRFDLR